MNSFTIKVSDLLRNPWQTDSIEFEHTHTEKVKNLDSEWISGVIQLQSINDSTVWVILENIQCKINDTCDMCLNNYLRKVKNEEYKAKFEIPNDNYSQENSDDFFNIHEEEIFPLNPKTESIDVEDMIVQAIGLETPFTKKCPQCEDKETQDDNDEEFNTSSGNIIFS